MDVAPHNDAPNYWLRSSAQLPARCGSQPLAYLMQQKSGSTSIRAMSHRATGEHLPAQLNGTCMCETRRVSPKSLGLSFFSNEAPWCSQCPHFGWVTMWREPFARVLSAFIWCRFHDFPFPHGDPLCLNGAPNGARNDVCTFATYWGSYQLAKLVHLPLAAAALSRALPAHAPCLSNLSLGLDPSLPEIRQLGHMSAVHRQIRMMRTCGLDDANGAGRTLIDAVKFGMSHAFRAIGLVERWNESMAIMAVATGCRQWLRPPMQKNKGGYAHLEDYWAKRGKLNLDAPRRENARRLKEVAQAELAACRPRLEPLFAADLELYAEASRLFETQLLGSAMARALLQRLS